MVSFFDQLHVLVDTVKDLTSIEQDDDGDIDLVVNLEDHDVDSALPMLIQISFYKDILVGNVWAGTN